MGAFKKEAIKRSEPVNPTRLSDLADENLKLFCWCNRCGHNAEIAIDIFIKRLGAQFPVPEVGRHMKCTKCAANDIATRPAWPSYGGQLARHL